MRILVTGGGTSGHISPALAVIQTLRDMAKRENLQIEFLYVGSNNGLEREIVTAAGVPFVGIQTGKLRRYFSVENLIDQFRLPVGYAQSLKTVAAFKPDVVFSTGGYVAVPPVIAAATLRKPILIHEQTVQIGLANRIISRFATRIALSFESARQELAPQLRDRAFVTGNPLRPLIFGGDKQAAKVLCGFNDGDDDLPTLYVTGGSQGARIINRAVEEVLPALLGLCRIVHQCGRQPANDEQDYDRLKAASGQLSQELQQRYYVSKFFNDEIKDVFALADFVVGRAGAGTVAELCALKKPAIYVPLVPTGGDEQTRNAQMCVDAGAAVIIKQDELNGAILLEQVQALLADSARLQAMSLAANGLARPEAAQTLAQTVLEMGRAK